MALVAGRDSNPWSLHVIYGYTHCIHVNFLFRPAAPAPTAFIRVFFILIVSLSIVVLKLKNETAPKTSWKYDGIGNPSAHEIKQVITTKRKHHTNLAIIFNPSNYIT